MDSTRPMPALGSNQMTQAMLHPTHDGRSVEPAPSSAVAGVLQPRIVGYGLPCVKCNSYFAANLAACPVCGCVERVAPRAAAVATPVREEESPAPEMLEEERESFLREFKAQLYAAHMQINASATFRCVVEKNHPGGSEPAAVCRGCYDDLSDKADRMEAALHMDVKDATKIIYDAVWSDPSDPGMTYQNAAQALLAELRRRAGISLLLGAAVQPLAH